MTTLQPRAPYSSEELDRLFPKELQLQQVQVLLRHGERTPVKARFQEHGLSPYWSYCSAAKKLTSAILTDRNTGDFDHLQWRRRLETFGPDDGPKLSYGPNGQLDAICQPGELTDRGRETTLALGLRLRHLYITQLGFMPPKLTDSNSIYLRATPMPRALESVQQAFWGMYPSSARHPSLSPPTIITRSPQEENLYPNDHCCRRFAGLTRAFAQRTADRWNDSPDMSYLNKVLGKFMPAATPTVAVDSHPRLSGIMDTVNATLAHGPETRLPLSFYDGKARAIIDKINVEEWYVGYKESNEYRTLGIGGLAADIVTRMTESVEQKVYDELRKDKKTMPLPGTEGGIKLALSGCHDTTLAGLLTSLGAFEGENWPPYTSHIAIELFRKAGASASPPPLPKSNSTWWNLFGPATSNNTSSQPIGRKSISELSESQRASLNDYYVRVRYNDRIMQVPGCKLSGKHLDGDTTFCTLAAFKGVVDKFTPKNWRAECLSNLSAPEFPEKIDPAGYEH